MIEAQDNDRDHGQGTLWLELTNGCNLECGHCYSNSSPRSISGDRLDHADYLRLIDEAFSARISIIQLIGGEPFLNRRLPELIDHAQRKGFGQIEIFSNLTVDRPDVLEAISPRTTTIATSVYSAVPAVHDRVTRKLGSFRRTVAGITRATSRGISVRGVFVETAENIGHYGGVVAALKLLGVNVVQHDSARPFGRGASGGAPDLGQLCGSCSGNTLCVTSDGTVSPCPMSRAWPIGNVATHSLGDITQAVRANTVREQIREATFTTNKLNMTGGCGPAYPRPPCGPDYPRPQPPCGPEYPRRS